MFPTRAMTILGGDSFRDEWSLDFDGSNDSVLTAGDDTAADATYVWWMKSSTTGVNKGVFGHGAVNRGAFHLNFSSNKVIWMRNDANYQYFTADECDAQDDGQWHQWALVNDHSDITACKLYIDGTAISLADGSAATSPLAYTTNLCIGADVSGTNHCTMSISEFAWYDTMLTDGQIKTTYNGREPFNHKEGVASANLKGWWRMGDGRLDGQPPHGSIQLYNGIVGDEAAGSYVKSTELVTNGTFTGNASGWTLNSGWAYDDNNITCSSGTTTAEQDISAVAGKVYKLTFDSTTTGNACTVSIGGSNAVSFAGTGLHEYYFVAENTNNLIFTSASYGGSLDNISVREVTGYAGVMINMTKTDFVTDVPR